jgi:hypothetical protein
MRRLSSSCAIEVIAISRRARSQPEPAGASAILRFVDVRPLLPETQCSDWIRLRVASAYARVSFGATADRRSHSVM